MTLGELLKASGLGLTLGKRKTLESELLKLRATPEGARARLRDLGLPLETRQKIEAVLQLDDRADDMSRLTPANVPYHDSGFERAVAAAAPMPDSGKKRLCACWSRSGDLWVIRLMPNIALLATLTQTSPNRYPCAQAHFVSARLRVEHPHRAAAGGESEIG